MDSNSRYLMHIGFDNSSRLIRNVYYFKYKNIKFKLAQNNKRYRDVLLSVLPNNTDSLVDGVFKVASEFLSALAWQNNSLIRIGYSGGSGWRKDLKEARCSINIPRYIPNTYEIRDNSLQTIPQIENEDQCLALALFREAQSSLNPYISFLFYWHILEIGQKEHDRMSFIDDVFENKKIHIHSYDFNRLRLGNKKISDYFRDDCRNAITHIIRGKGKRTLKLDSYLDYFRMVTSERILKEFAKYYIKNNLNLKKRLFLIREKGKGFPTFVSEDKLKEYYFTLAYNEKPNFMRQKR